MTDDTWLEPYLSYLRRKILERDWHAVSDCANDLRELEAEERGRRAASGTSR